MNNDHDMPLERTQQGSLALHQPGQLAIADVLRQHELIQEVIEKVMIPGHHYGVIPGTEARQGERPRPPVLLKPGAEKLCMVFRLAPSFSVQTKELAGGHREERVTCTLTHIPTGYEVARALGSCSTMESKYRYRNAKPKCPACGVDAIFKSKQQEGWYCWTKKGGCGAQFTRNDKAITGQAAGLAENKDIADTFNTVLKMAVKRAHVAATLLATAASDAFVVDEEEVETEIERDPEPTSRASRSSKSEPEVGAGRKALLQACLSAADAILKAGGKKQQIVDLLGAAGVTMSGTWSGLTDTELTIAKQALEAELAAGREV